MERWEMIAKNKTIDVQIPSSSFTVDSTGSSPMTLTIKCTQQELIHGTQAYCDMLTDDEWEHIKIVQDRRRERKKE